MPTRARAAAVALLAAILLAHVARAQVPEGPYVAAEGRVTVAGEISATFGRSDRDAFFNYTDYEHNALRTVRARLLGEWRASEHVALLGELRIENQNSIEAAALYIRWRPWLGHQFDLQAGRIPPVIGAFPRHAYGRDNLVIGAPLAYQYLTSLRPDALPGTADDLLRMRARGWQPAYPIGSQAEAPGMPLVSAFHWDTGAEAHWQVARLDLAGALTRGSPAAPAPFGGDTGPTWSGRAAVTPAPGLTVGVSAARGAWIDRSALRTLLDAGGGNAAQSIVGTDAEFGLGRWLVRGEWLRSAFRMPSAVVPDLTGPLAASSGFVEGRYRWHPRWQTAVRIERLTFSSIAGTASGGLATPWDAPVTRAEAVLGFRAARNVDVRAGWQQDWREAGRVRVRGYPAVQVLYWF